MLSFLTASQNMPFTVALVVMLGIAILEGVTTILGAALSSLLDTLVPDIELGLDADMEGAGAGSPDALTRLLGWLRVGKVPVLMILVIFLTAFGLLGLGIQSLAAASINILLPAWLAVVPALIISLPVVRILAGLLERVMPKDETEAVSEESFIGRIAMITLGAARVGNPAQAKVRDEHGLSHYIMLEPDVEGEEFQTGEELLLVRRDGTVFKAIRNSNSALSDN